MKINGEREDRNEKDLDSFCHSHSIDSPSSTTATVAHNGIEEEEEREGERVEQEEAEEDGKKERKSDEEEEEERERDDISKPQPQSEPSISLSSSPPISRTRSSAVVLSVRDKMLQLIARLLLEALDIRTNRRYLRSHSSTFLGRDAVKWLCDNKFATKVDEAVDIGRFEESFRVRVRVMGV